MTEPGRPDPPGERSRPSDGRPEAGQVAPLQRAREASRRQDWAGSAAAYEEAIEQAGAAAPTKWYVALAKTLRRLRRHEKADAVGFDLRQRRPTDPAGWIIGAEVAAARGDWAASAEAWHDILQRFEAAAEPGWSAALVNACSRAGNVGAAVDACTTGLARFPGAPSILLAAARAADHHDRPAASAAWALRAAEAEPSPAMRAWAVRALLRAGRFAQAAEHVDAMEKAGEPATLTGLLRIDLALVTGDFVGADAAIAALKDDAALVDHVTPSTLTRIAFEVGRDAAGTAAWMARFCSDPEAIDAAIRHRFSMRPAAPVTAVADVSPRQAGALPWRTEIRQRLMRFLATRHFKQFEALVSGAVVEADARQCAKLLRIAETRFPRSRLPARLRQFLSPRTPTPAEAEALEPWRHLLPQPDDSIAAALRRLPRRRLVCVTVIRDEAEIMGHFLAHHRAIGIRDFIIIDNGSEDGLAAVLGAFPDLSIIHIDAPGDFAANRHGMCWINDVLEAGIADWVLFADADEMLVYPGSEAVPLTQLIDHLDARGETVLPAFMLDLYDTAFRDGAHPGDAIAEHRWFLADQRFGGSMAAPYRKVTGGIRLAGGQGLRIEKAPLVRASAGIRYTGNHSTTPARPSTTTGALLHYKIFRDRELFGLPPETVATHSRIANRADTAAIRHVLASRPLPRAVVESPFHQMLSGTAQLVRLGYLAADAAWRCQLPQRMPEGSNVPAGTATGREEDSFGQFVDDALLLAQAGRRVALRHLLRVQLPRIGDPALRLALCNVLAALMRRDRLRQRLAAQLVRSAVTTDVSRIGVALDLLFDRLSLLMPEAAATLAEGLRRAGMTTRRLTLRGSKLMIAAGRPAAVIDLLAGWDLSRTDRSFNAMLTAQARLGLWPDYYRTLQSYLTAPGAQGDYAILRWVNRCPDDDVRLALLDRMRSLIAQHWEALTGKEAAIWLAILRCLDQDAALADSFRVLRPVLPPNAAVYFDRLMAQRMGLRQPRPDTAWCLGLSKTGTTSFNEYCRGIGLAAEHYTNSILGRLLDAEDMELFDVVSDTPVVQLARIGGVTPGRRLIVTHRAYDAWQESYLQHFSRIFGKGALDFDRLRDAFRRRPKHSYGARWHEIHDELYFRYASLREAYEAHEAWLAELSRQSTSPIVRVELDAVDKAETVSRFFLGAAPPTIPYPHSNRRRVTVAVQLEDGGRGNRIEQFPQDGTQSCGNCSGD